MKTIFILSHNHLGLEFWKDHLGIQDNYHVIHYNSGQECISALATKPVMLIVDDYWASFSRDEILSSQVLEYAVQHKVTSFHVSPEHFGLNTSEDEAYIQSNFNEDVLDRMRAAIAGEPIMAA